MSLATIYLDSIKKRFMTYKMLGDQTLARLNEEQLHWQPDGSCNSIYLIIKHMSGNMLSRWTDFLTSDGEKPWRNRDTEFNEQTASKSEILAMWEKGWTCMFDTFNSLQEEDLEKTIHIRTEPLIALDAINRQLSHLPYHVGQIVYIGKMLLKDQWESLSIAKGRSDDFNQQMASGNK
ncbi:DUF1572 domain-containing protein [Chitinophaga agrisoli]|uniref:DUF1572 domain-containing protein n=1 Tax=Chitinophaga agrisoli TaxID=2607653 RepID=A0A5B2VYT7_9BACT|nr:DUF1572 family protein [Chitinophaga agrisoli]KAA2243462.1 DUF1572 domain-containing protein [Chitinophaga agrisoli]